MPAEHRNPSLQYEQQDARQGWGAKGQYAPCYALLCSLSSTPELKFLRLGLEPHKWRFKEVHLPHYASAITSMESVLRGETSTSLANHLSAECWQYELGARRKDQPRPVVSVRETPLQNVRTHSAADVETLCPHRLLRNPSNVAECLLAPPDVSDAGPWMFVLGCSVMRIGPEVYTKFQRPLLPDSMLLARSRH
jgi:hypothetical protein